MSNVYDDKKKAPSPLARLDEPSQGAADKGQLRGKSFVEGEDALAPDEAKKSGQGGTIAEMKGEVSVKLPRAHEWVDAAPGTTFPAHAQVQTGEGSSCRVVFADGSDLRLGNNALLVIYGGSAKNAKTRERTKTQVLMREGTVKGGLAALDQKKGQTAE